MPGFSLFFDFIWTLLEGRVLHKGAWVATLLRTLLGVQDYKKVKFQGRDISSLVFNGLNILPVDAAIQVYKLLFFTFLFKESYWFYT